VDEKETPIVCGEGSRTASVPLELCTRLSERTKKAGGRTVVLEELMHQTALARPTLALRPKRVSLGAALLDHDQMRAPMMMSLSRKSYPCSTSSVPGSPAASAEVRLRAEEPSRGMCSQERGGLGRCLVVVGT
jgi:hypothetical protein